jgi:hypothetical protein
MTTKKQKFMSIENMCNEIIRKSYNQEDVKFWVLRIKEICEEALR